MNSELRIGTRESNLALWQAKTVEAQLKDRGRQSELILIKSSGDIDLVNPLYELGVQGIFTKVLDVALLNGQIDIAVHSYKDVPTQLAEGIKVAAVLKRGDPFDMLVCREKDISESFKTNTPLKIATSSIRRKAQWLFQHKNSEIDNIRGNVNSRLHKLAASDWDAAIFAAAGLQRLNLTEKETGVQIRLDWMIPAPAQGAIVVVCRADDERSFEICHSLNDEPTAICTKAERDFLRLLLGGCATPISAYAEISGGRISMKSNITAADGSEAVNSFVTANFEDHLTLSQKAVTEIINKGGKELLKK